MPAAIPLLLVAGVSAGLAVYAIESRRRGRATATAVPFGILCLVASLWACAYGFQLMSATVPIKLFWSRLVSLGAVVAPTAWVVFVISFTDRSDWLTRRRLALLAIEPAIGLALAWTAGSSDLFFAGVSVDRTADVVRLSITPGPAFAGHLVYSFGLNLLSGVLLAQVVLTSRGLYRRQALVLLGTEAVVVSAGAASVAGLTPGGLDLTPLSIAVMSPVIGWALFHYRLLEIVPVARDKVLEEMGDPVIVVDREQRITDCNPASREVLPAGGDILGRSISDVLPEAVDLLDDPDGDGSRREVTVQDGDVQRIFILTVSHIGSDREQPVGFLVVLREVTERRHTERRFRALIETASDLITVHDPDGTVTYCSPSVEGLLGYEQSDLLGTAEFRLIHPDDRHEIRDAMDRLQREGRCRIEYRIRRSDGAWRTFEGIGADLLDDPAVGGLVFASRDVTHRREYEQRLGVLNRVLRHDLRSSLTVVLGNLEFLTEAVSDQETLDRAEAIREQARKLEALSEKARHIDQQMANTGDRLQCIDVAAVLRHRLADFRETHPEALVEASVPDERYVRADPMLDAAIEYVFDNAVLHNDAERPTIAVSLSEANIDGVGYVDVTITDDGPGLPADEREVLLQGVESPLAHTSGLGLWLVNWIVGRSKGELRLADREPHGTEVTVRLLAADAEAETEAAARGMDGGPTAD